MSVNIRGREYATVNERVAQFRNDYGLRGSIQHELLRMDADECVVKCSIFVDGNLVAVGHAWESKTASNINKTSYLENAETSSCGRALAFLGYGIDGSIASADEVAAAIAQQEAPRPRLDYSELTAALEAYAQQHGMALGDVKRAANAKLGRGATQEDVDMLAREYREATFASDDIRF